MAQPDAYLVGPHAVIVFEIKLTQRESGLTQIGQLYRPLLQHIYAKPIIGVLVCKNLIYHPGKWLIDGPEHLIDQTVEQIYTWQYLG